MNNMTVPFNIDNILKEDLILTDIKAETQEELFSEVSNLLVKKKIVKDSFYKAIIDREADFPTGLNTSPINVAIPHADTEHVNKAAIVITKLDKPIIFNQMDKKTNEIKVELAFFLIVDEKKKQAKMLSSFVSLLQSTEFLNKIKSSKDSKEIKKIVQNFLSNNENE